MAIDDSYLQIFYSPDFKKNKQIFVQRIGDSGIYLLLFPTGLMYHLSVNPLSIQAKIQLNLQKDEPIIEVSYCLDEGLKRHCLWIMDEKYQVWKCSNELSPTSTNWSLSLHTSLDNRIYKRFLRPAMTYDQFYDISTLFDLQALKELSYDQSLNH